MTHIREKIMGDWPTCRAFARYMSGKYGAGWDEGMISRLACGVCWPTAERLKLLCLELDCSPGDLYDVDELQQMAEMGLAGLVSLGQVKGKEKNNDNEGADKDI